MMNNRGGEQENRVELSGAITIDTVVVRFSSPPDFPVGDLVLDLDRVEKIDSSGLALLLLWRTRASAASCRLRFVNCPEKLKSLAGLTGLEELFGQADT